MIDDIDSSSSTLRLLATQALKTWQTETIFDLILDEDYIVRTIAARELQKRGDSSVYPRLICMLADCRDFVREIAVFTIGQYGTPTMPFRKEAKLLLTDCLSDTSPEVRASAAAGLGHLCYDEMPQIAEDKLISLSTTDTDKDVKACIAYALGNSSGTDTVRKALDALKDDENSQVSSYAQLGLELLESKG